MSKQTPITSLRILLVSIGVLLIFNAVFALFLSNIHLGIVFTFIFGIIFLIYGAFFSIVTKYIPKVLRYLYLFGIVFAAGCISVIYAYGQHDTVTYKENAVIVLGSGIKGEELTDNLRYRLDAAAEYYRENKDVMIVVSGGMGTDETIAEALAMERYLLSLGIPSENIIKEDAATSTLENFRFSKEILDEYFGERYTAAYITSDYHIYRAGFLSEAAGFDNPAHTSGKTPLLLVIPNGLRECLAIVRQWGLR